MTNFDYWGKHETDEIQVGETRRWIFRHGHGRDADAWVAQLTGQPVKVSRIAQVDADGTEYRQVDPIGFLDEETGDFIAWRTATPRLECPLCGRQVSGKVVRGKYNEGRRCDSRCEVALGPSCECRCSGRNHGSGLSIAR